MRWLLPEYVEDILPPEAGRIEFLRRRILDLFAGFGYQLVMPPLLEYVESLLTGTGYDMDLRTFKLVDQISGRMMGVRADITPQVARLDAHLLNRRGVTRLCYAGSVLHTRPAGLAATREPIQIGAEIYGHASIESDLEIQRLLSSALAIANVRGARLDIGHVAIFRSIIRSAGAKPALERELFEALQRKDLPALGKLADGIARRERAALLLLPELYGGPEVLDTAARRLPSLPGLKRALATLRALADTCTVPVSFDLAELRGYHYHSGVVFEAYGERITGTAPGSVASTGAVSLARGGRYDEVGLAFGRPRPATGFSIDLRELAGASHAAPARQPILAPCVNTASRGKLERALAKKVEALRAAGEIVIEELPGHARERAELGCTRALVSQKGVWRVVSLKSRSRGR
jgi:ATP phosphoribosyltransferase regulatory subunit